MDKRCIVNAPPEYRYVALSYVWGGIPFTKTTARNIALFREERGLDQNPLLNTITDSMKLVSLLGERYLWVDAVCIVQDDENAKAEQIAKMDLVYAGALLTIVAASGDTAAAGLPGVRCFGGVRLRCGKRRHSWSL